MIICLDGKYHIKWHTEAVYYPINHFYYLLEQTINADFEDLKRHYKDDMVC